MSVCVCVGGGLRARVGRGVMVHLCRLERFGVVMWNDWVMDVGGGGTE